MNRHSLTWAQLKHEARDNPDWPAILAAALVLVLMATRVIE
jgi:hypothetical protein